MIRGGRGNKIEKPKNVKVSTRDMFGSFQKLFEAHDNRGRCGVEYMPCQGEGFGVGPIWLNTSCGSEGANESKSIGRNEAFAPVDYAAARRLFGSVSSASACNQSCKA
jgi:hypothetical protein